MLSYNTSSTCSLSSDTQRKYTDPVGQLVEIGKRGEIVYRFCTGFNILGGTYFMTARHCTSSDTMTPCPIFDEPINLDGNAFDSYKYRVNFNYDLCRLKIKDTRQKPLIWAQDGACYPISKVVDACSKLDYKVLQLDPGAARHGSLELSPEYLINNKTIVALFHHPEGYPKQYSDGKVTAQQKDTFSHSADTQGGSSGAPVISQHTCNVIGVHILGDDSQMNHTAVKARSILGDAHQRNKSWAADYLKQFGIFNSSVSTDTIKLDLSSHGESSDYSGCC